MPRSIARIAFASLAALLAITAISGDTVRLAAAGQSAGGPIEYRVLATSKTSTMEKELNEAAEAGFWFSAMMGGETAFGGNEAVIVMARGGMTKGRFAYKLLATSKTSTMEKEMQAVADLGFEYVGQTVFVTLFGGSEVVVLFERDKDQEVVPVEYRLIATSKTTTLQKELLQAGGMGFGVLDLTVGKTAMGGTELVAITRRVRNGSQR